MLKKFKSATRDWALSNKKRSSQDKSFKILTMCKKCYTFYYKKSWHFESPNYLRGNLDKEMPVRFTQCPACLEQEQALFERETEGGDEDNFSLWNNFKGMDDSDGLAWNS